MNKFLIISGFRLAIFSALVLMIGCQNTNQTQQHSAVQAPSVNSVSTPLSISTIPPKKTVSYGVTRKAYEMMADGMTKAQCDEIVGFSGDIYKTYKYAAGSGLGAGGYFVRWRQGSSEISAQFDNGSLIIKFNENLNDQKGASK